MGSISSLRMDVKSHFQAAQELRSGQISGFTAVAAADEAVARGNDQGRGCRGKRRREDPADEPSASNGGESICVINRMGYRKQSSATKVEDENLGIRKKLEDQPFNAPKQDYIHVRARRGQATDSHSLAERARRERISERMKTLQDLVPGCNKIIGKASVLDEIINYIQSLQQQVEFLSMKLEAVSSRANSGLDDIMSKDLHKQAYEADSSLRFGSQAEKGYGQRSVQDWLHMQVGSPVE